MITISMDKDGVSLSIFNGASQKFLSHYLCPSHPEYVEGNAGQPKQLGICSHVSHHFLFFSSFFPRKIGKEFFVDVFRYDWLSCFTKKVFEGYLGNCFSSPSHVSFFYFFSSYFGSSLFNNFIIGGGVY